MYVCVCLQNAELIKFSFKHVFHDSFSSRMPSSYKQCVTLRKERIPHLKTQINQSSQVPGGQVEAVKLLILSDKKSKTPKGFNLQFKEKHQILKFEKQPFGIFA